MRSVQGPRDPLLPPAVRDHAVRPDPRAESRPEEVLPAHRARVPHLSHAGTRARGLETATETVPRSPFICRPTGLRSRSNLSQNVGHTEAPKRRDRKLLREHLDGTDSNVPDWK